MPRPDFEKFLSLTDKEKIAPHLTILYGEKSGGVNIHAKVGDERTVAYPANRLRKYCLPVWVDIFPVDGCPSDPEALKKRFQMIQRIDWLRCETTTIPSKVRKKALLIRAAKPFLIRVFTPYMFLGVLHRMMTKYNYDCADRVIYYGTVYGLKDRMYKEYFDDVIEIPFEGTIVKAPRNYHQRLSDCYGDYMTLPPEEKRVSHDLEAYWLE